MTTKSATTGTRRPNIAGRRWRGVPGLIGARRYARSLPELRGAGNLATAFRLPRLPKIVNGVIRNDNGPHQPWIIVLAVSSRNVARPQSRQNGPATDHDRRNTIRPCCALNGM